MLFTASSVTTAGGQPITFNVTRLKQAVVDGGYVSQQIVDDEGAAALIETELDEMIAQDAARGSAPRMASVDPVAGNSRWEFR